MNEGYATHRYGTAQYWTRDDALGTWHSTSILPEPEETTAMSSEPGCQEATMAETQIAADTDDDVSRPSAHSSQAFSEAWGMGASTKGMLHCSSTCERAR